MIQIIICELKRALKQGIESDLLMYVLKQKKQKTQLKIVPLPHILYNQV